MATDLDRLFFIHAIFFFQELRVFSSMLPDWCLMAARGEKSGDGGWKVGGGKRNPMR